jgi:hypothetical protein
MRITEIQLRKVIRKMIMEVTGTEAEQFTSLASSVRSQDIPERNKVGMLKQGLGSTDKEFNDKIQELGNLLGIPFDPVAQPEVINTILEKALAKLK